MTILKKLGRNPGAIAGMGIVSILIISAAAAPLIAGFDPAEQRLKEKLLGPSHGHPLGQDSLGRDILSRIVFGSRISLYVGIVTTFISVMIGVTFGLIAGYSGGWIDEIIMRIVDVLLAFPGILLAIALTAVLGPGINHVVLALSLMGWVGYTRLIRGQVLVVRELGYVEAAKGIGAGSLRIVIRHVLPNVMAPVLVQASFGLAGAIVAEAGLSFLGLGVEPPVPSWGSMLDEGRLYLGIANHMTLFPGLSIMISVLGFNFLGDALRDAMDVKGS